MISWPANDRLARRSGPLADPLEPVEDQVEPERELALGSSGSRSFRCCSTCSTRYGNSSRRKLLEERRPPDREGPRRAEVQLSLPQREAHDVAVQRVIRVIGHRRPRSPASRRRSQDRVHVPQPGRARSGADSDEAGRPAGGARSTSWAERSRSSGALPSSRRPGAGSSISPLDDVDDARRGCRPCWRRGCRATSPRPRAPARACACSATRSRLRRRGAMAARSTRSRLSGTSGRLIAGTALHRHAISSAAISRLTDLRRTSSVRHRSLQCMSGVR